MTQNNSWREQYADALDLGERPEQEYIEYELFNREPPQQMVWMPGEGPVPFHNPNSITAFPWQSYLTNSWLMAGVVGTLTMSLVVVLAATQNQKNQPVAIVDKTQSNIDRANQVLTQSRNAEVVAVTKYDYNPGELTNPGLLQRAIFTSANEFNQNIKKLQASDDPTTRDQPKEILVQRARVEVQKIIDMGAAGRGVVMIYEDPATGKATYSQLDSAYTVGIGLLKLLAIEASQRPSVQTFNMPEIATAIRGHQNVLKTAQANLLGAQGWVEIANQLNNFDSYGQKIIPNLNSTPTLQKPAQAVVTPKKAGKTKGKKTQGGN